MDTIPVELKAVASKELEKEVEDELNIQDPDKTKAQQVLDEDTPGND